MNFRVLLAVFLTISTLFAIENLKPAFSLEATGGVQSIYYKDSKLYAGTDNGTVEVFDLDTQKRIKTIKIPDIEDFMGDTIASKIYSIDLIDDKILIVSQGMKGYRNLWLYENDKLTKLLDISKRLFMTKASFVDSNRVLISLLSNQIILYDIKEQKNIYIIQVSASSFSHFMLNPDKKTFATTDESGIVRIIETDSGRVVKTLEGQNVDRVYQLDYKKDIVLTAGQDRRSAIYKQSTGSYLEFHFLLYSCALSPSTKLAAVAYNENNDVLVYDTGSKDKLYNLIGQDATLTQILFINEKEVFASSDSTTVNYWKLK